MTRQANPGGVEPSTLYPMKEIQSRLTLGATTFRAARRNGLPVRYFGRTAYILGADMIGYIMQNASNSRPITNPNGRRA